MSSRVAIIIPAYNAGRYVAWTLESVLAQTEADWTCVIVDDGSSDDTAAVVGRFVERDPRFKFIRQSNGGVCKARTVGLAALDAETEYLIFLDADDIWLPHTLARLIDAIEAPRPGGESPSAVHAIASFIDHDNQPLHSDVLDGRLQRLELRRGKVIEPSPSEPTTAAMLATWPCIITPGIVLIRRSAWDAIGDWDTSLSIGEDWELWYRLSLSSPIAFLNEPLIQYRVHASSSMNTWRRPFKLEDARAKIRNAIQSSAEQKKHARRAFRAMARRMGFDRLGHGCSAVSRGEIAAGGKLILGGSINLMMSVKPL